jgi:hypothetical protein
VIGVEIAGASIGLRFGPRPHFAALVDLDMNDVRMAADRAVFGIFLAHAGRQIDRHDDFLAAGSADIAGFFLHTVLRVVRILPCPPGTIRTCRASKRHR